MTSADRASSKLLAYLQLFRLPNVFTAAADVMMGFVVMHGSLEPVTRFVLLLGSSCLIYLAGMVLNDVFDADLDAVQRPLRPIPSGRIRLARARQLGWALLLAGTATGWATSWFARDLRPGAVASVLAVCVVLYDGRLKNTAFGPIVMGSCRSLNVLLGMSLGPMDGDASWGSAHGLIALSIGIYIAGVTWFARREAQSTGRWPLALSTVVMLCGILALVLLPKHVDRLAVPPDRWAWFLLILTLLIGWRCLRAIAEPTPRNMQRAVKNCIHSLIILDAAVCLCVDGAFWAIVVLMLLVPTAVLGRWVYST